MFRALQISIYLLVILGLGSTGASAHAGGLDAKGCHHVRATGQYHCHGSAKPAAPLLAAAPARPASTAVPRGTKAVDGDTISFADGRPNLRLVGCDAPESWRGQCTAERKLARKAKFALQGLLDGESLELQYVKCSCAPGTEGTADCNHGRDCGILRVSGRNVCDLLIARGLAAPFLCTATSCPPQRDWCN